MKNIALLILAAMTLAACTPNAAAPSTHNSGMNGSPSVANTVENTIQTPPSTELATEEAPQFLDYSEERYNELIGEKPFAIFFHATWCPTCIAMEKEINTDIKDFPNGSKILQADFDTEIELRKQYNINTQSTIVIIDSEGNKVTTLAAPSTKELIEAINTTI